MNEIVGRSGLPDDDSRDTHRAAINRTTRVLKSWSIFLAVTRQALKWHEHPAVISWWRRTWGWALRWLTPRRRRLILAAGVVGMGVHNLPAAMAVAPSFAQSSELIVSCFVAVAVFGVLWLFYLAAAGFTSLPGIVRRHPQLSLHLFFWGLLVILWNTAADFRFLRSVLLGLTLILPILIWRLGYLCLSGQRGKVAGSGFGNHLIYLLPLHAGFFADTPFGKGLEYLSRHEAKDEEALARSQLAGIKLILLAICWFLALSAIAAVLYGVPNRINRALDGSMIIILPAFGELLAQGGNASGWKSWLSVYLELVRGALFVAMWGHLGVGVMRVFGFNIFRNTYKPLLSETLVQFWGRWEYYWKEILVDFFFLPTFAKRFQKWPAVRMFAAVFAAAFVGNMYGYVILPPNLQVLGLTETIWELRSRFLYCFLLAVGIYVSMRREQRRAGQAPASGIAGRVVRIFWVWTFFALIRIWDHYPEVSFVTRTKFFFGLFGLA